MSIIDDINSVKVHNQSYNFQLERVRSEHKDTDRIDATINQALENLKNNKKNV